MEERQGIVLSKKKLTIILIVALLLIIGGIAVGINSWSGTEIPSASQVGTLDINPGVQR